jgi:hypothetical protein
MVSPFIKPILTATLTAYSRNPISPSLTKPPKYPSASSPRKCFHPYIKQSSSSSPICRLEPLPPKNPKFDHNLQPLKSADGAFDIKAGCASTNGESLVEIFSAPIAPMKVLAWNCWGLACAPTIRTIRAIVRNYMPDILFLFETKVMSSRYWNSLFCMGFSSWLQVSPVGFKGALFMTWKQGFVLKPIQLDANQISCLVVSTPPLYSWMISCVDAPPFIQNHSGFWPKLTNLSNSFGGPWLMLRDFNAILSSTEKCGGRSLGSTFVVTQIIN